MDINFFKQHLEQPNKASFLQQVPSNQQYQQAYRSFMFSDSLFNSPINQLTNCIENVHNQIKADGKAIEILKDIAKVYTQQLIQQSVEVASMSNNTIDEKVVDQAHFRLKNKLKRKNLL